MTLDSIPSAPLTAGALLVASPQMLDPNFMHSVIMLCAVGEHGCMGFALNESTGFKAGDLLSGHSDLEDCEQGVLSGGPVGKDEVHFLHRLPTRISDGTQIIDGLWLGGKFEDLTRCLQFPADADEALQLFVGYSGWGPGQLEIELAEGAWIVLPGTPQTPFECHGDSREEVWRGLLRAQGPGGLYLSQQPPDPTWN